MCIIESVLHDVMKKHHVLLFEHVQQVVFIFIIPQKCFQGYTGISVSVHLCVRVQDFSFCQSSCRVIKPFQNKPWFLCVCTISLLKTLREKEKLLVTSNFSFFHRIFYPFGELSIIFIKFIIDFCKLFRFGRL